MKSELLSQERNVVVVRCDYEADEAGKAVGRAVRELSGSMNIRGFRKGHVPRKMLEMYIGRPAIYRQAIDNLVSEAVTKLVEEYDLDLIAEPSVNAGEFKEGEPLSLTFTFEARPEVTLPEISEIEIERPLAKVTEERVSAEIKAILERGSTVEPSGEDRPAVKEDIVEVEYTTSLVEEDGSTTELEKDRKSTLALAAIRPDLADAIVGHKLAEEFTCEVSIENDYPDKKMAGRRVRYSMEILQFMRRVVPEETDAEVERITRGEIKTVAELREKCRQTLEQREANLADMLASDFAVKALAEKSEVDVPDTLTEREFAKNKAEQTRRLELETGLTLDKYLEKNSLSAEEYDKRLRDRAKDAVRNSLVLEALARRDDISFTADDFNAEIIRVAQSMGMNPQELADRISKDREQFMAMANRVRISNTISHLLKLVKIKEVDADDEAVAPAADDPAAEGEGR